MFLKFFLFIALSFEMSSIVSASSIKKFNIAVKRMECRSTKHDTLEYSWVPYLSFGRFLAVMAPISFNTVATTTKDDVYVLTIKFLGTIFIPNMKKKALRLSVGSGYQKWFSISESNIVFTGEVGYWFGEKSFFNEIFIAYTTTNGRDPEDIVEYQIGFGMSF